RTFLCREVRLDGCQPAVAVASPYYESHYRRLVPLDDAPARRQVREDSARREVFQGNRRAVILERGGAVVVSVDVQTDDDDVYRDAVERARLHVAQRDRYKQTARTERLQLDSNRMQLLALDEFLEPLDVFA